MIEFRVRNDCPGVAIGGGSFLAVNAKTHNVSLEMHRAGVRIFGGKMGKRWTIIPYTSIASLTGGE